VEAEEIKGRGQPHFLMMASQKEISSKPLNVGRWSRWP